MTDVAWIVAVVIVQMWRGVSRADVVAPDNAFLVELPAGVAVCGMKWPMEQEG